MTYDFLIKAQEQPDLNDFCDYLKKPLLSLQEIQNHYKKLQLSKKVDSSNMDIYYKIDTILERHLPEMVNNYCDFSFDYRNSKQIDINNISLTPKELLLKNLSKVIEEIEIIEAEFNKNNSFNAVVQNKVLENLGYQPELCLETNSIVKKSIQLENKFDYNKFVESHEFKKTPPEVKKVPENKPEIVKKEVVIPTKPEAKPIERNTKQASTGGSSFLIEAILGLSMITLLSISCYHFYSQSVNKARENKFIQVMQINSSGIKTYYSSSNNFQGSNFKGIKNESLIEKGITKPEYLVTPWGHNINIKPYTIDKENDSFAIEVPISNINEQTACTTIMRSTEIFDMVKIDDIVVKNIGDSNAEFGKLATECMSGTHKKISLINKGY